MRAGRAVVLGPIPERGAASPPRGGGGGRERGLVEARDGVSVREEPDGRVTVVTPAFTWKRLRPLPVRTSATTCSWPRACSRRLARPACPSTCRARPGAFRVCAGRGVCSVFPAARPCSSTAPTTPRGRARSRAHLRTLGPFVLLFGVMADKDVPRPRAGALSPRTSGRVDPAARRSRRHPRRHRAARAAGLARRVHREPEVKKALALRPPAGAPGRHRRGGGKPLPRGRGALAQEAPEVVEGFRQVPLGDPEVALAQATRPRRSRRSWGSRRRPAPAPPAHRPGSRSTVKVRPRFRTKAATSVPPLVHRDRQHDEAVAARARGAGGRGRAAR